MIVAIAILSSVLCVLLILLFIFLRLLKKGWIEIGIPTKNKDNIILQELEKEIKKDTEKVL